MTFDKAFEDCCKTINMTKKDFFLKIDEQARADGWNVIVHKLRDHPIDHECFQISLMTNSYCQDRKFGYDGDQLAIDR